MDLNLNEVLPLIKCDSSQMQQVLINLIMNGAEAAQSKTEGKVIVRTDVTAKGDEVVLDVSDNGDGIPPENIPKLFTPFFTTKGEGKGVGLGLAVVYGIVQAHNGDIEVKSKVGIGTTFRVTLPIEPQENVENVPLVPSGQVA
jgi:two-component system, NtrC family, sensor kinase